MPQMPDSPVGSTNGQSELVGTPHKQAWYWRLLGLYDKQTHATQYDTDGEQRSDAEEQAQEWWRRLFHIAGSRLERYRIFEEMDGSGMVSSFLDIYAEEATQPDHERGRHVWIESKNEKMIKAGNECLHNIMIEDRGTPLVRRMCKMGDGFQRNIYQAGKGVIGWKYCRTDKMHRVEDKYGRLVGFRQDGVQFRNGKRATSWPWDYTHFRLLGKDEETGYGTALLDTWFNPWRTYCIAAGTLIWTTDGPTTAESVCRGQVTYAHDPATGETRKTEIVAVLKQGVQKLVRIRTAHRQIVVTANHGMLARDKDGNFLYKRADHLVAAPDRTVWPAYRDRDSLVLPRLVDGDATRRFTLSGDAWSVLPRGPVETPPGIMDKLRSAQLVGHKHIQKVAHAFLRGKNGISHANYLRLRAAGIDVPPVDLVVRTGKNPVHGVDLDTLSFEVDARFARFLGFMLGDGWFESKGIAFALGEDDGCNTYYIDLCRELFNCTPEPRGAATFNALGAGHVQVLGLGIKRMLESVGFIHGFAKKRVPSWLYGMSLEVRRAFLQGMFDADAGFQSNGWRLGLSNEELMRGCWTLAQMSGYRVSREIKSIDRETTIRGKRAKALRAFRIFVSDEATDAPVVYEPVTHVEPIGEGETYDITVADDLHNFVANGVVSHNTLSMDAVLMYRLRRAPDRNMVLVDVGNMEESEAMDYVNQFKKAFRKNEYIDPASPNYRKQFNPLTPWEDVFLPVRGADSETRIEPMSGAGNAGEIQDVDMNRKIFCGVAKIPAAYIGFEGDVNAKATLLQQDVRFARTIKRIQKAYKYGIRQTLDIHYTLLAVGNSDYDPTAEENRYLVCVPPSSYLDELERLELIQLRSELMGAMAQFGQTLGVNPKVWSVYILTQYAKLPEDVVLRLLSKEVAGPEATSVTGGGNTPEESLTNQKAILEAARMTGTEGYYCLSSGEKKRIAESIHRSPALRKIIGDIAEAHLDDQIVQQTDPSTLPPLWMGQDITDGIEDSEERKQLNEDLETLRAKKA